MNKLRLFWTWIAKDRKRIIGTVFLVILTVVGIWKLSSGDENGVLYQISEVEKGTIVSWVHQAFMNANFCICGLRA